MWSSEEEEEETAATADPFIYETSEGAQILVSLVDHKEVKLPGEGKKHGCADWSLRSVVGKGGNKSWVVDSASKSASVTPVYVEQLVVSKYADKFSEGTNAEILRRQLKLFFTCLMNCSHLKDT